MDALRPMMRAAEKAVEGVRCVHVLDRDPSPGAAEARSLLVRLSGRQMKRGRPFTESALLAGLWVLLAMLDALDHYSVADLRRAADSRFPAISRFAISSFAFSRSQ
jgi:hypothetical protein